MLNEGWHFLAKPFIPSQLRALVVGLVSPNKSTRFSEFAAAPGEKPEPAPLVNEVSLNGDASDPRPIHNRRAAWRQTRGESQNCPGRNGLAA